MGLKVRILGPLEASAGDGPIPLGGLKQRALFALLVLHANEGVRRERLIDELWGESPPKTAVQSLNVYVSRLRKLLANGSVAPLETRPEGYALRLEPGALDLEEFERLLGEAREANGDARPAEARRKLERALALWRGRPLADLAYESFAQTEIARLEELRLAALEERFDADLALGLHAEAIPELKKLVGEHPLRERLIGQLMLALYRAGRESEALELYARTRRALAGELGLEPSERLRELERRILQRDDAVAVPASRPVARPADRRRGRRLALVGAAGVSSAAIAVGAILITAPAAHVTLPPNSVGSLDPATNALAAALPVGERPGEVAARNGSLWVVTGRGVVITRIDAVSRRVVENIPAGGVVRALAAGPSGVWFTRGNELLRVDPRYNRVAAARRLCSGCGAALAVDTAVWTTDRFTTLARVDPLTSTLRRAAEIGAGANSVAVGSGAVWVAGDGGVTRVDPATLLPAGTIATGGVAAIATGAGAVWVVSGSRVLKIDPASNTIVASAQVGNNPSSLAVGAGGVWVTNSSDGTISRLDPHTGSLVKTIRVGRSPVFVAVARGRVWFSAL